MIDWKKTLISPRDSILAAIKIIDESSLQIALVVDKRKKLLGTLTDGDVRRGMLRGIPLDRHVSEVMKKEPVVASTEASSEEILQMMKKNFVNQIPLVDFKGRVAGLEVFEDLLHPAESENTWVVIMAGGAGTRLMPLTGECPKPLLKVGGRPLLEIILNGFIEQGFREFYFSVNYLSEKIMEYFGDGSKFGVRIHYIVEKESMGTAGALGLLKGKPEEPLIVMNGDLLTKVNYRHLLDFHHKNASKATMCVRKYSFEIPYGIVKINRNRLIEINEKPVQEFFANAGIYVLEPEMLDLLPSAEHFDMPTLFNSAIKSGKRTIVFPIREYWLDIGHHKEFEKANIEYEDIFLDVF